MNADHVKEAVDFFAQGYSCYQAIFSTYAEENGLDPALARRKLRD